MSFAEKPLNNMSIYKAFNHQHVPEIRESLKQTQGYLDAAIDFIPYRGDFKMSRCVLIFPFLISLTSCTVRALW